MKRTLLAAFALCIALSSPAAALTFETEHIMGYRQSNPYAWVYSYDIGFFNNAIQVDVDLAFGGHPVTDTLWNRWETGIESMWSTSRFDVPILFNVDRVPQYLLQYDYLVNVVNGSGRANMLQWYTTSTQRTAAHEFGHMTSKWDEYTGGAVDPVTGLITYGLMGYGTEMLDHYFDPFLEWYEAKMGNYEGDDAAPVPEPGTVALMIVGMAAVVVFKRKQIV